MGKLLVCFVRAVSYNFIVYLLLCTLVRGKVFTIRNSEVFIDESLSNEAKQAEYHVISFQFSTRHAFESLYCTFLLSLCKKVKA